MTNEEIKLALQRVLRNELGGCQNAIKKEDFKRAKRDLDTATMKIDRIIRQL
ncbi:hypothetical protein [Shinella sp. BE166]|uniref:hypothetical protein n=1 Tax=unclassified Shinella TaxID=2643062 RepID=UPI003EC06222